MKEKVLVTAPKLHPDGVKLLNAMECEIFYLDANGTDKDVQHLMESVAIDAVISRTVDLSAEAIQACPTLKVISKHGVGVSNINVVAATKRGIPVYVTPGANAQSVAEMTMGLLFSAARKISWMDHELRTGNWARAQNGIELKGKTIALLGFGQIGQIVAKVCLALGMRVIAFDPAYGLAAPFPGVQMFGNVDEMLPEANVLSLHVPLNKHTKGLVGTSQFSKLPDGAIFINTARGEVVDEQALIQNLCSGKLFAAGVDTTMEEPIPVDSPLLKLENLVVTPHVGGSTPAALAAMATCAVGNILGFMNGNRPPESFCVNPQVFRS